MENCCDSVQEIFAKQQYKRRGLAHSSKKVRANAGTWGKRKYIGEFYEELHG